MWGRKQGIQDFFNRNGARFTAITEAGSNGPISHGTTPLAQARYPLMRRLPRGPASGHRPQAQGRDVPWRGYHAPYNVAKLPVEFVVTVSRARLRPRYGEGFRGAPLEVSRVVH
ncbi:MAG: hypothetical protein WA970_16105, partial [Gammaproteobacteria bacterium]